MKQLMLLVCIFTICFTTESISAEEIIQQPEQDAVCGLSGIVVDSEGKPLSGFKFSILSSDNKNGNRPLQFEGPVPWVEVPEGNAQKVTPQRFISVKTDADGKFDVPNIIPGQIQIMPLPEVSNEPQEENKAQNAQVAAHVARHLMFGRGESGSRLVSIRLNKLTFFYPEDMRFETLRFGLKPNAKINDVKITVKKRMKIYAQVVYANGTPVANAEIDLDMDIEPGDLGTQGGHHGTDNFTDAKGYFLQYTDDPGYYTLAVEHRGFTGGAGPFILTEDKQPENLVIKLNGSPTVKKEPKEVSKEFDEDKARNIIQGLLGKRNAPLPIVRPAVQVARKPEKIVWIINPANGHAYAKIRCGDWYDAQQKAIKEGAHLVSINNEEEQFWIESIFQSHSFWIGLNDVEKEGVWQWDSGEPVTYTNWSTFSPFRDNLPDTEKDVVAMTNFFEGGWQSSGENTHIHRTTHEAVIEKDGLVSKVPVPEEDEDE
ncbi:hypothetical protein F4225_00590 [Candidatus Poribacteria bacterium]|nr:hypothetical protein [Candidatus Poribacteria bacterium]